MRRSKAPSVLNKARRLDEHNNCSDAEEQYDWGSRTSKSRNRNKNKRIFNVVWRDVSTRKHKIWKGDGSLEVDNINLKATLKDETGRYIGCLAKVDINELVPDFQMVISGKEIEIQNEIQNYEELENLRKIQAENFAKDEWAFVKNKSKEANKPKVYFKFKPVLVLKSPKLTAGEPAIGKAKFDFEDRVRKMQHQSLKDKGNELNLAPTPLKTKHFNEFICFLKPSELQQFLFQKVLEYLSFRKYDDIESLEVELVLKLVCNHPSLINHKITTNELLRHLISILPDWTEMASFDSSKLEFVQYFLTDLTKSSAQSCIIIAKNPNVLNMLQGLCDFMKIKCLRLNSNNFQNSEPQVSKFCLPEDGLTYVILVNSWQILSSSKYLNCCKKIIIFEECVEFSNLCSIKEFKDLTIYYLVTAFSIEELYLLDTYYNIGNLVNELANMNKEHDCCYLYSIIGCNCFENANKTINAVNVFNKYWKHFQTPFDMQLLKMSSLENSSENIVSIFCKKNNYF